MDRARGPLRGREHRQFADDLSARFAPRRRRRSDARAHASPATPPHWREQAALLVGAVVWLLALLALATHSAADPGFSTSGSGGADPQPRRHRSAPGSPTSPSSWSAIRSGGRSLVGARAWLGALARALRAPLRRRAGRGRRRRPAWTSGSAWRSCSPPAPRSNGPASTSGKAQVAGGNAGGVLGYVLGQREPEPARLRRLGRALDRRAGRRRLARRCASPGCASPSASARRSSRCARAGSSASSAPRTRASARRRCASATRSLEVEHELQEQHLPIVIEPTLVDVPKSTRVVKERQKPLFSELVDTKLPQVDLLDSAPQRVEERQRRDRSR